MEQWYYSRYAQLQYSNWWFVARSRILYSILSNLPEVTADSVILDFGCGPGGPLLKALSRNYKVIGIDESAEAVNLARRVGFDNVHHCQIEEFVRQNHPVDVVLALDVIEHIQDDLAAVIQVRKALRPGGLALITVPAFPSLWSPHDEVNHHYRRYTRKGLKSLISEAGFSCQRISFFNTILFPLEAAGKIYDRLHPRHAGLDYNHRSMDILNSILERVFAFERCLLAHTNLPFGISLLALGRRTFWGDSRSATPTRK